MLKYYKIKIGDKYLKSISIETYDNSDRIITTSNNQMCGSTKASTGLDKIILTENKDEAWSGITINAMNNIKHIMKCQEEGFVEMKDIVIEVYNKELN
jgi:hypothetical protein